MKKPVKISKILKLAAKRVETGAHRYSCVAIIDVVIELDPTWLASESHPAHEFYCKTMCPRPYGSSLVITDFDDPSDGSNYFWTLPSVSAQNHRVLALCMAAAIAEAEGQ